MHGQGAVFDGLPFIRERRSAPFVFITRDERLERSTDWRGYRTARLGASFVCAGRDWVRTRDTSDGGQRECNGVVCQKSVLETGRWASGVRAMKAMSFVLALLGTLHATLKTRTDLTLENLALRQQLALLRRRSKRPQFGRLDRLLWVWLCDHWAGWREALQLVRPETVIRWHRQGFRAFWTWKSRRRRTGRPPVGSELADLVRTMALANPLWGAPRIHGELLKLGLDVSQRTVARLMPRRPKPPSQSWRTFLQNHVADLVSVDFFVVPTATFRILYVFVVLLHHRRRVVHFNVTDSPTAAWTAQQIIEAFPDDSAPRYLLRDRDTIYAGEFRRRVKGMRITEVLTAPRSPWQNPFAERSARSAASFSTT